LRWGKNAGRRGRRRVKNVPCGATGVSLRDRDYQARWPMQALCRFIESEDGPTAVEYAVMLALILAACLVAIDLLGTNTAASFGIARDKINTAVSS
jgi:pilus assembly protein Flp/PilA